MITICEECGKKYKLDPAKIAGAKAHFNCKSCGHLITVSKPAPVPTGTGDPPTAPTPPEVKAPVSSEDKAAAAVLSSKEIAGKEKPPVYSRPSKIRFGLTAKLFAMMIFVSLVPLAMYWGITLKQTKDRMQYDTIRHINQISISIAGQVEEWVDKNARILKMLANMEDIISMDRLKQEPLLETVRKVYPWVYLTFTLDADGQNVARNDGRPLVNYSGKKYYKDIMQGKALAWQTVIDEPPKKPVLILAVPIIRYDEIVGVIANGIRLDNVSERVVNWRGEETGFAFMVDEKGKVIAHKNKRYVLQQANFSHHPLIAAFKKGHRGSASFTDQDGKSFLGQARETALGWIVAIVQEKKEAFYLIDQLLSYAYLLLAVTVAFVFIIAWFSGRTLSRPIIKLTDAADRISVGELDVKIDTKRKDEIGDLAVAVARMQDSIRLSIERLRQRR